MLRGASATVRLVRLGRVAAALILTGLVGACSSGHKGTATATTGSSTSTSVPPAQASGTSTSTVSAGGCANGVVTDAIRSALVAANGSPGGEAVPGDTYYGICGSTSYAVAHFRPAANATLQEQVSFQDDGAGPRFFVMQAGGGWTVVGNQPYNQVPSCAGFTQLPAALRTLWQDCPRG